MTLATLGAESRLVTGEEDWGEPNGDVVPMPDAVFTADAATPENPPVVVFPGGPEGRDSSAAGSPAATVRGRARQARLAKARPCRQK